MSKRQFGEMDGGVDTASVLMLLSRRRLRQRQQHGEVGGGGAGMREGHAGAARVFECRTCGRRFPTFQALGGHRASHKRPRYAARAPRPAGGDVGAASPLPSSSTEEAREVGRGGGGRTRAAHGCPVCGLEFAIGQALGGHMRRHRAAAGDASYPDVAHGGARAVARAEVDDVVIGDECTGRVCLDLDLNLTPSENCAKCRHAQLGVNSVQRTILLDCPL